MIQSNYKHPHFNPLLNPQGDSLGLSRQETHLTHKNRSKNARTYNYLSNQLSHTSSVQPDLPIRDDIQPYGHGWRNTLDQRTSQVTERKSYGKEKENYPTHHRNQKMKVIRERVYANPLQELRHPSLITQKTVKVEDKEDQIDKTIKQIIENQAKLEEEIRLLKINDKVALRIEKARNLASNERRIQKEEEQNNNTRKEDAKNNEVNRLTQYKSESILKFLKRRESSQLKTTITAQKQAMENKNPEPANTVLFSFKPQNQRLIVTESQKQAYWERFSTIFAKYISQTPEDPSASHHNKKYEQDYLVNTNQLQKKLRQKAIQKIFSQSDHNLYK